MNPPTEQLIRDYLSRVSVAALGRLSSGERREFLTRTREELERETRGPDGTDPAAIQRLLSGLGQPEALVELERARLALAQDLPGQDGRRLARLLAGPAAWLSGRSASRGAAASRPAQPADDLLSRAPMTGDIRITGRPITARRRPGGSLQARPPRPSLRPSDQAGTGPRNGTPVGGAAGPVIGGPGPDSQRARARAPGWPHAAPGGPGPDIQAPAPGSGTSGQGAPAGRAAASPVAAMAGRLGRAAVAFARQQPAEAAAVVLLGLGGLIYPPVWLLGAAVAALSRRWELRDKWVGLAGPPLLVIAGITAVLLFGGKRPSIGGYAHEAWVFADYLSRVAAVAGAAYLTWRARQERRKPPTPPWNRPHRI